MYISPISYMSKSTISTFQLFALIPDVVLRYRPKPKTKAAKRRKRREKRDAQAGANQAN